MLSAICAICDAFPGHVFIKQANVWLYGQVGIHFASQFLCERWYHFFEFANSNCKSSRHQKSNITCIDLLLEASQVCIPRRRCLESIISIHFQWQSHLQSPFYACEPDKPVLMCSVIPAHMSSHLLICIITTAKEVTLTLLRHDFLKMTVARTNLYSPLPGSYRGWDRTWGACQSLKEATAFDLQAEEGVSGQRHSPLLAQGMGYI